MIDKDAFRQVLINLINNAIEAMPLGGTIRVSVRFKTGFQNGDLRQVVRKRIETARNINS